PCAAGLLPSLWLAWSVGSVGRSSRTGRRNRGRCHTFPCGIHIFRFRDRNIVCCPFLSTDSRPHLLNSSLQSSPEPVLCVRSRSNSSSRPCICEYPRLRILNHYRDRFRFADNTPKIVASSATCCTG